MISAAIIIERTDIRLGGAERSIAELTEELAIQGVKPQIIAAAGIPAENTTILCSENPGSRISLAEFEMAIKRHLADTHYDIVHSVLPFDFADIYQPRGGSYKEAMLQHAASYSNPTIAAWKRWTHFLNRRRTAYLRAEQNLCRTQNRTIIAALSDYVKQQFIRHYQMPDKRISVIPNGINTSRIESYSNKDTFRNNLTTSCSNPVLFLLAANNFRLKGLRQAISAMQLTLAHNPQSPAHLIIAGSDNPAPYRAMAKSLGIEDRIVFIGSQSSIAGVIAACDAAILPTWYDPSSRFILEAIAAGKPVITTRCNGASEQYQHRKHGFVIENPDCISDLSSAIDALCDSAARQSCTEAIRTDRLIEQVSITRHVGQLRQLYDIILSQKKG